MSILFKGMEMPTCCCVCPCFNDEYCYCQAADKDLGSIPIDSRHSDCPLIEVPEDVAPVVHGKWVQIKILQDDYKAKECSACKATFWDLYRWNYCPNCGAKMDGET